MKLITGILVLLFAGLMAFGQKAGESTLTPEELGLRSSLENDKSIIQLACGLILPISSKGQETYAERATKQQAENTRIRLSLYNVVVLKKERIRARFTCKTKEATVWTRYLLSDNGKLTIVGDFSRDNFGSGRITSDECTDLVLGHYVVNEIKQTVFETFDQKDAGGKIVFLACTAKTPDKRQLVF